MTETSRNGSPDRRAVVAGPDADGLADALDAVGFAVERIRGVVNADALDAAGVADADLFALTDLAEATAIPVARERNPDVRIVAYSRDSLPEFARGQIDFAVDPDLLGPDAVAEELAA